MSIVTQPNFLRNLEKLIETNEKTYYDKIGSFQSQIPQVFQTISSFLYRGMILDSEFVDGIRAKSGKLKLDSISSWSLSEDLAKKFVTDPKYRIGKIGQTSVGVIFKYKPKSNDVILNIGGLISFLQFDGILEEVGFDELAIDSAVNEQEVILKKGIILRGANIYKKISV